jgi:retron-type reverse transcriptase
MSIYIDMYESSELKFNTVDPLNPCKIRTLFSSETANFSWHLLPDKANDKLGAKVQEQYHVNRKQTNQFETGNNQTEDPSVSSWYKAKARGWISFNKERLIRNKKFESVKLINCRSFSTSNKNYIEVNGDLESKLISQALKKLKIKEWPTEDLEYKKQLDTYIEIQNSLAVAKVIKTFIPSDAIDHENESGIIRDVNRSEMDLNNQSKWEPIMASATKQMSSILYKIKAIDNIANSSGKYTPGADNACFKLILRKAKNKEDAIQVLYAIIKTAKTIISIAKGKTDQAIARKGIGKLTEREKKRRYLKSTKGSSEVIKQRKILKEIEQDPMQYLVKIRKSTIKHNNRIKHSCLQELKNYRLWKYKSDDVLRIMIPKSNNKLRPLGIPTMKDRSVQMLLKLVMEPYLEPLGDQRSFGYRPGRNCFHATTILYQLLTWRESNISPEELSRVPKRDLSMLTKGQRDKLIRKGDTKRKKSIFYTSKWVLDADIKSCFDRISHSWLIENVPMPKKFEHLLVEMLKTRIVERTNTGFNIITKPEENNYGIPEGGIISPILMNWTLDGIEEVCLRNACVSYPSGQNITSYLDSDKLNYYDVNKIPYKNIANLKINLKRNTHFLRYADDFLVVTSSEEAINNIKLAINKFLVDRGLELSKEKTKIIRWTMGTKIDFLGWTYHLVNPRKVNWLIWADKSKAGKLSDWKGLYIYPSRKSTKNFRNNIKKITSISQIHKDVYLIIREIINTIVGWSNYFSHGPKQTHIRHHLDKYVSDRIRKFLRKKYNKSYPLHFKKYFQNPDGTLRKHISIRASEKKILIGNIESAIDKIKPIRDRELKVPKLTELHLDSNSGIFNPPNLSI